MQIFRTKLMKPIFQSLMRACSKEGAPSGDAMRVSRIMLACIGAIAMTALIGSLWRFWSYQPGLDSEISDSWSITDYASVSALGTVRLIAVVTTLTLALLWVQRQIQQKSSHPLQLDALHANLKEVREKRSRRLDPAEVELQDVMNYYGRDGINSWQQIDVDQSPDSSS